MGTYYTQCIVLAKGKVRHAQALSYHKRKNPSLILPKDEHQKKGKNSTMMTEDKAIGQLALSKVLKTS